MKVIINLSPDGKANPWPKFLKRLFSTHRKVVKKLLPPAYKNQANIVTHRVFDAIWGPLYRLAELVLVFEYDGSRLANGELSVTITNLDIEKRVNFELDVMREFIDEHTVILMGEPFAAYTNDVRDAFYQWLSGELIAFTRTLYEDRIAEVSRIAVNFQKK